LLRNLKIFFALACSVFKGTGSPNISDLLQPRTYCSAATLFQKAMASSTLIISVDL